MERVATFGKEVKAQGGKIVKAPLMSRERIVVKEQGKGVGGKIVKAPPMSRERVAMFGKDIEKGVGGREGRIGEVRLVPHNSPYRIGLTPFTSYFRAPPSSGWKKMP
jgi:hypothetical protein